MRLTAILSRYSRVNLIVASAAGIVAGASSTALLAFINRLLAGGRMTHQALFFYVGLSLLVPITGTLSTYLLVKLGQQAIADMRLDLSGAILRTPLIQLEGVGAHRLLAALTEDVMSITQAVGLVPAVCMSAALVAGCLGYLGWLSWRLLVVIAVLIVVGGAAYQLPLAAGGRHMRRFREASDALFGSFRSLTDGVKELKLSRRRRQGFLGRLEEQAVRLRDLGVSAITLLSLATNWGQFLVFITLGALFFADAGTPQVRYGFVLTLLFMMGPLQSLLAFLPQLSRADAALRKIEELGLRLRGAEEAAPAGEAAPAAWRQIELRGVTHAYHREGDDRPFTLGPLDLDIRAGEALFIVGGNGSGKTTLAKILCGLYAPQAGEVRVDGQLVDDAAREQYRERFAVVFADFYVFDELLGVAQADLDGQVHSYLARLQLAHKVRVEGARLSTTSLSQGQRKRLALLSAYLEDRPIYLFDEWAADQDPAFKDVFYRQLLPELKARGKTVCVISHDDHYYALADRLLKLDDGRIESDSGRAAAAFQPQPQLRPPAAPAPPPSAAGAAENAERGARWLLETHLPQRVAAQGEVPEAMRSVFEFVVPGAEGGSWRVDLRAPSAGAAAAGEGAACTVTVAAADLMGIADGRLNPRQAFEDGRLQVAGDFQPEALPSLVTLLRLPPAARAPAAAAPEADPDDGLIVVSLRERPDLIAVADAVTGGGWPEFMLHNPVAHRYWKAFYTTFPDFQFALVDRRRGSVLGVGNSVPLVWRQEVDGWPAEGWDFAVTKAFADHAAGLAPTAQCGLSVTLDPAERGKGLSARMVRGMAAIGRAHGLASLIVALRPSLKSRYPLATIERYAAWQRGDGLPFDPWLRVHAAAGARIAGICARSARIEGSVAEWSDWAKMQFPESGRYAVPGALVPVAIDLPSDRGTYVEPNIWVHHQL